MKWRSSPLASFIPAVLWAAAFPISAQELSYEEIATLNVNLEPSAYHFTRGDEFLYGASNDRITGNGGMIYRLAPGQPVEILHEFPALPSAPLANDGGAGSAAIHAMGPDGAFYGLTSNGGPVGLGVLFRYAIDGTFSIIDSPKPGGMPLPRDFVVTASGDIYGVAMEDGGVNFGGTLFRRSADGSITVLHSFTKPPSAPPPPFPGVRPRPPFPAPEPGPPVDPFNPIRIREGPDGKLYGITFGGGGGYGTFFSFHPATGEFKVLSNFSEFGDYAREMIPAEGGFRVLRQVHLLHVTYDGTVTVEVDGLSPPFSGNFGPDFRSPIVETPDGIFVESAYGGANSAGYVARFRPGEGASVVYNYPTLVTNQRRTLAAGSDGKIYGVIGYPPDYVPPAAEESLAPESITTRSSAPALKAAKKPLVPNPRSFRFRKPGDSVNFPPFARPDSAWLPAKASTTGTREVTVDILANDKDPDLHPLAVTSVTPGGSAAATLVQTSKGQRLKVVATGTLPASQRLTYQLSDGNGGTSTGSVAIFSPLKANFTGPVVAALAGAPAGSISVKISGRNAVTATFILGGKKYSGRGTLDVDDTTDIQLKLRGESPIALRADVIRSGPKPQLEVFLPAGGTVYSAILDAPVSAR